MLVTLENLRDHRPEPNLMIRKVKILNESVVLKQIRRRKEQGQIFKRNMMIKLKAYIATMIKTRYQRKNSVQNSGIHQSGQKQ